MLSLSSLSKTLNLGKQPETCKLIPIFFLHRSNGKFDEGYCITDDKGPILRNLEHLAIHIRYGNEWAIIGIGIIIAIFLSFMASAFVIYLILRLILKVFLKCFGSKKAPNPSQSKEPADQAKDKKTADLKKKTQ